MEMVLALLIGVPILSVIAYYIHRAIMYVPIYREVTKTFCEKQYNVFMESNYRIHRKNKTILITEHSWGDSFTRKLNEQEQEILFEHIYMDGDKYFVKGDK